ncbi:YczE/YyaS/YitT family protein [Convivina intestini]|uniref:Putative membrane protein YczE n=1 Tax=Convivina intestini TaxID=1505726 RepID=A0A2U1D9A9_9LACO|nr:hypothetical protein [Convivina intestini]PVY84274.1 putative membrane protein YczE [Convivina intestini]CAH1855354.1 hypothetical protein R077811_01035 [Convivina intestini]SDB93724.1 Uncharacterized membrane protein YczE [Leuconostocaceae bacterium R-53105]
MYYRDGEYYELKPSQTFFYFIVALILNAFGNGLSVASNMGSAPWTAGAANLAHLTGWPISLFLMLISTTVAVANLFFADDFDLRRLIGNVFFGVAFSFLVGFFTSFFTHLGVTTLPLAWRIPIDLFAVMNVGIGISIYQRVNLIMHPIDDLTNILRFKYFRGNASKAQMSNFVVAIAISLTCFLFSHQLVALNIGTAFSFFFQGKIIAIADRRMFPHLVHGDLNRIHRIRKTNA